MAPRTLKETYARKKSSEFVESAISIHGVGIAATLAEKLTAELQDGEEMQDVSFFLRLLARRLGRMRNRLVAASQAHFDELANDDEFRVQRDEAMTQLTSAYITARQTVTSGYSVEDALAFGFETNVATTPEAMELQVERLLANFAKPEVQLSEPLYPAVKFDPAEGEATFRPLLEKLKAARRALDRERRKADATLLAKNRAVAENDVEFTQISRCFESIFALGDRADLARRVRPSARRPGRRQEVEDEPSPEGPERPENNVPDSDSLPAPAIVATAEEGTEAEAT